MNISEILDTMDDLLEKAWGLPLSGGKCVVDVEKMTDLIGEIRLNMPNEVKQAKRIVADRSDIIGDAKKEAEQMIRQAQVQAKRLINDQEIAKQAQAKANEMILQAHTQSKEIKRVTTEYIDRVMLKSEEAMAKNLMELKEAHGQIRKAAGK